MIWLQRAIGAAMLIVLALVPATATMCAIVCGGGPQAAAHCQEADDAASAFQLGAAPRHDCGSHEAVFGEVMIASPIRWAPPASTATLEHPVADTGTDARHALPPTLASSAPPGSHPPTTTPSVLRV